MLELAATLQLTPQSYGVQVRVINETAHKLPSGYPEGRRMWLHVAARDSSGVLVYESGAYDAASGVLTHDEDAKVYEIHLGLSPGLAGALGMPAGPSFHFVLNDTVYHDNRIPPYGMSYDEARRRNVLPVPESQFGAPGPGGSFVHWDEVELVPPVGAAWADIGLLYQPTSWEYVQYLYLDNRRENAFLANEGVNLLEAWRNTGMARPFEMASTTWGTPPAE